MGFRLAVAVLVGVAALAVVLMQPSDRQQLAPLRGKNVLLCGASEGIGRSMALLYAQYGANVVIAARTQSKLDRVKLDRVKEDAKGPPGAIYPIATDLTDLEQVQQLIAQSKQLVGHFDIVVLNHIKPYFNLFEQTSLEELHEVMDVDLRSYVTITKLLLPDLIENDASLVAVSSVAGKIGVPYAAVYSASKHALHGFFDALRLEVGLAHPSSKMSITTCVIGNVDTESAVQMTKGKLKHDNRVTAQDTAAAIVKGALRKQREVYFPLLQTIVIPYMRLLVPTWTESLIVSAVEKPNKSSADEL